MLLYFDGTYTWSYANGSWRNLSGGLTFAPSPRIGMTLVDDPADGYVLGWGGFSLTNNYWCLSACNDTWMFRGGSWSRLAPTCYFAGIGFGSCGQLLAGGNAGLAPALSTYDDACKCVVITTSNGAIDNTSATWSYSNGTWTDWCPNFTNLGPVLGAIAYDAADRYVVGFAESSIGSYAREYPPKSETWSWTNGSWTNISSNVTGAPSARYDPAMSWDGAQGVVLLYGGWNRTCLQWYYQSCLNATMWALQDTWAYVGGTWTRSVGPSSPPPLAASALVYDPDAGASVLFSGWHCPRGTCLAYSTSYPGAVLHRENVTWVWGTSSPMGGLQASVTPLITEAGQPARFQASILGGVAPLRFDWDFGDGTLATGANVQHAYATSGVFNVSLAVTDSAGHWSGDHLSEEVTPGLVLVATSGPPVTDAGWPNPFNVTVTGGRPPIVTAWNFGDSTTWTGWNATHAFATAGTANVSVWVNDSLRVSVRSNLSLLVHARLSISPMNFTVSRIELGRPMNFSVTTTGGTGAATLSWYFGDGGLGGNLSPITHVYTTDGPFTAFVTATDSIGQAATAFANLTVLLNASIWANASLGAAPLPVSFDGVVSGGTPVYSASWSFGDGLGSTDLAPVHTYLSPGIYEVALTVRDSGGQTAVSTWKVDVAPGGGALTLGLTASASLVALGSDVRVVAQPAGGIGRYDLNWPVVPPGCSLDSPLQLTCSFPKSGVYQVVGSLRDATNRSVTGSINVTVGQSLVTTLPGPRASSGGVDLLAPVEILGGVLAAALVGYWAGRRRGGGPPSTADPLYFRYRDIVREAEAGTPTPPRSATPNDGEGFL